GPPGDVKACLQFEAIEHPQNSVDTDARTEATLLEIAETALGLFRLAEQKARFGVDVERENGGGLLAFRPLVTHGREVILVRTSQQPGRSQRRRHEALAA